MEQGDVVGGGTSVTRTTIVYVFGTVSCDVVCKIFWYTKIHMVERTP